MKQIDITINVSTGHEAVIKLPDDVLPGKHHVILVIDDLPSTKPQSGELYNPEGLWAGQGNDISSLEIAEARDEMWGKFKTESDK